MADFCTAALTARRLAEIALVDGIDPVTGDYRTLNAHLPPDHQPVPKGNPV